MYLVFNVSLFFLQFYKICSVHILFWPILNLKKTCLFSVYSGNSVACSLALSRRLGHNATIKNVFMVTFELKTRFIIVTRLWLALTFILNLFFFNLCMFRSKKGCKLKPIKGTVKNTEFNFFQIFPKVWKLNKKLVLIKIFQQILFGVLYDKV